MRLPTRVLPVLLVACAALLPSGSAHADEFFGITPDDQLIRYDALDHTPRSPVKLTGLGAMGHIVSVDVRPATGGLYGVTANGASFRLVRIDQATGAVTPIGAAIALASAPFGAGIDFNPLTDQVLFVADNDSNLSFDPDTGAPTVLPPPSPATVGFVDVAYTGVSGGYAVAVAVDSAFDQLDLGNGSGFYAPAPNPLGVNLHGNASADFAPSSLLWLLFENEMYRADFVTGVAVGAGTTVPLSAFAVRLTGAVDFGASAFGATESDGSATVTLRRAAPADSAAKVRWATGGGTATAGTDYTPAHGVVTFAAGQSTATVTIPLANDGAAEGPERIGLHLASVDGVPAGPDAAVVIADDDGPAGGGAADTTAPVLLALPLKLAAKRTVKLPFGVSEAGPATVTLKLGAKAVKRLHLPTALATVSLQARPGDNTAVLNLSRKAAHKIRSERATRTTAVIVASDAAGNRARRTMKVTLT